MECVATERDIYQIKLRVLELAFEMHKAQPSTDIKTIYNNLLGLIF